MAETINEHKIEEFVLKTDLKFKIEDLTKVKSEEPVMIEIDLAMENKKDSKKVKSAENVTTANECDICGKQIKSPCQMIAHMMSHSGKKPFECKICGKMFSFSWDLRQHEKLHENENNYKCKICPKVFKTKQYLN